MRLIARRAGRPEMDLRIDDLHGLNPKFPSLRRKLPVAVTSIVTVYLCSAERRFSVLATTAGAAAHNLSAPPSSNSSFGGSPAKWRRSDARSSGEATTEVMPGLGHDQPRIGSASTRRGSPS